jgi:hypothetical protein
VLLLQHGPAAVHQVAERGQADCQAHEAGGPAAEAKKWGGIIPFQSTGA